MRVVRKKLAMSTQATPLSARASKRGEEHVVGKLVMHTVRLEQPITVQFVVYAAIADNTDVLPPHDMVTVVASRRLFTKFSQLKLNPAKPKNLM